MHAFTTDADQPEKVRKNVEQIVLDYLTAGIDPEKSTIFVQSEVPAIAELSFLFSMLVSLPRVLRNPTIKSEIRDKKLGENYPFGFLFIDCCLIKETPDIPTGSVRLGRPRHPSADPRASGSAVFIKCYMDDHLGPIGYAPISSRDSTGQRIWFEVEKNSRFFEYGCYGPGAIKSSSRPVLSKNAAAWYTISNVLNGWIPEVE